MHKSLAELQEKVAIFPDHDFKKPAQKGSEPKPEEFGKDAG